MSIGTNIEMGKVFAGGVQMGKAYVGDQLIYNAEFVIFDGGNTVDYTGGWTLEDRGANPSIGTTINLPSSSRVVTKEKIPSGYTTLHITCDSGGGQSGENNCSVTIKTQGGTGSSGTIWEKVVNKGDNEYDISTAGDFYLRLYGYYRSFTVSKIWLT